MSGPIAQLGFEAIGDVVVGRIQGEIESANADDLRAAIAGRLSNAGAGLVLDLSETTYLDSAGIELLFDLARRLRTHRQRLGLVVPEGAPMRRVLDLCDIEGVAPVDSTLDAALAGLQEPAA